MEGKQWQVHILQQVEKVNAYVILKVSAQSCISGKLGFSKFDEEHLH